MGLLGNLHPGQVLHRDLFRILLGHFLHPDRSKRAVLQDREVRKQVEVLKHHADLAPDGPDILQIVRHLDAIHDDLPALVLFQAIDAADHGRFARPRRTAHDDPLSPRDRQIDALQHMKFAKPLIDIHKTDNGTNGRIRLNR
jgi:hypothetical protein